MRSRHRTSSAHAWSPPVPDATESAIVHVKNVLAVHEGGLRFVMVTGSAHELVLDDGVSDTGARPTESFLASLVACTAMDIASLLTKKRQAYTRYTVESEALQRDDYPQVFTRIDLIHVVEGVALDEVAVRRCIELSATKYCPINAMISAGPTEVHHRYRIVEPPIIPAGEAVDAAEAPPRVREGEVMVTGPYGRIVASTRV